MAVSELRLWPRENGGNVVPGQAFAAGFLEMAFCLCLGHQAWTE